MMEDHELKGIYESSADDLVKRMARLLENVIKDGKFDPPVGSTLEELEVAGMHDDIVAAFKFIAVLFSPVYLENPMDFPKAARTSINVRYLTKDYMIDRIKQIVEVVRSLYFMAGALGLADFSEMHGDGMPPERALRRNRELFARLQTVGASLSSIESTTSEWLKQHHVKGLNLHAGRNE